MTEALSFRVVGVPAPQGSKVRTRYGGLREANPNTRPWRAAVAASAAEAMQDRPLIVGPVLVEAVFWFPRPRSHFRTGRNAHMLKPSAPLAHAQKPDADKLARAVADSLSGIALRDDAQIASWSIAKRWGEPARVEVYVAAIESAAA